MERLNKSKKPDDKEATYHIEDRTNANWPGCLPYRHADSVRGYRTREDAERRLRQVVEHYNKNFGCSPGDLRIVERNKTQRWSS